MFADVLMRRLAAGLGLHIHIIDIPVEDSRSALGAKDCRKCFFAHCRTLGRNLSIGNLLSQETIRFAEE